MRQTKMSFANEIERKWYVVDATDLVLGRMSTEVANILRGSNKVTFTPHEDHGDYVIIVNAEKVVLTGNKVNDKMYYNTSQYVGNLRKRNAKTMIDQYPEEMVRRAIWGMIPHNRLGRKVAKKLFIYAGPEHKHGAQNPEPLEIKTKGIKR